MDTANRGCLCSVGWTASAAPKCHPIAVSSTEGTTTCVCATLPNTSSPLVPLDAYHHCPSSFLSFPFAVQVRRLTGKTWLSCVQSCSINGEVSR